MRAKLQVNFDLGQRRLSGNRLSVSELFDNISLIYYVKREEIMRGCG